MLQTSNTHASKIAKCCKNCTTLNFKVSYLLHSWTSLRLRASTSTKASATVFAEAFVDCWLNELHAIVNFNVDTHGINCTQMLITTLISTSLRKFLMFAPWLTTTFNKRTWNYYHITSKSHWTSNHNSKMHFIHLQTGKKRLKTKSFSRPASSLHKPWCLQLLPSSQTSSTNNSLLQLQMQSSNCCIIFKMLKAAKASEKTATAS